MMVGFHLPWFDIDVKIDWELVVPISLAVGALIGAAQGYLVAYSKIPSFIVTLGGMLIFRGLTGNMLLGQFVGPFPKSFQNISAGFIPDFDDFELFKPLVGGSNFHWGSMIVGIIGAAVLIYTGVRRWSRSRAPARRSPGRPPSWRLRVT